MNKEAKETLETAVIDTNNSEILNTSEKREELSVDKTFTGETKNGLPFQLVSAGEEEKLGEDATVQKGVYILAPTPKFASALLDKPEKRKVSTGRAAIAATILGAVAAGGCLNGNGDTGSAGDNAFAQMHKKMSLPTDIDHFSSKMEACFTEPGDKKPNIGTFNGETVVTFIRNDGVDHCYYVKATDLQTALDSECNAQLITLPGIVLPGDPPIHGCVVHNNKAYYQRGGEPAIEADLTNGGPSLTASNPQFVPGNIMGESITIVQDGGTDYILGQDGTNIRKYDIPTGTEEITTVPDDCGIPHLDPDTGVWVGSRFDNYAGPVECRVIKSTTLNGLASSLQFVPNIMWNGGGLEGNAKNPRIMGEIMVFEGEEDVAGVLQPSKIYYAIVMEYCGDGTCDATETNSTCPGDCPATAVCGDGNLDAGEVCDDNNTVDGDGCSADCLSDETCGNNVTDTTVGEVCDDGNTTDGDGCSADCSSDETCGNGTCDTNEDNATCPTDCPPDPCGDGTCDTPTEDYNNCATDCEGECGDGVCDPTEDNTTCVTDCPANPVCGDNVCEPPETNATCPADCASDPACQPFIDDSRITFTQGAENCELTDCVDIPLEESPTVQGKCTFKLDFGNTNTAEVTIDGAYKIDFIEQMGEMLSGQYSVDDNGNDLGSNYTKNGNTVETVVEGTQYSGEEITIPENGHDGYHLECSEGQISVHKNGEHIATLNAGDSLTVDMEESGSDPDAGVDGGTDAGTTPPGKPSCSEGCNSSKDKLPAGELAFIGLLLLALARRMRKQREASIMENAQRVPGNILYSHVKSRIAKTFDGLRG